MILISFKTNNCGLGMIHLHTLNCNYVRGRACSDTIVGGNLIQVGCCLFPAAIPAGIMCVRLMR